MKYIEKKLVFSQNEPLRRLPEAFVSASIDTSLIVGGYWWEGGSGSKRGLGTERIEPLNLAEPTLIYLARQLGLGYLRIGGTEADRLYYRIKKKKKNRLPEGYGYALDYRRWKQINRFCAAIGTCFFMTLNAGPGSRGKDAEWKRKNARSLIRRSSRRHKSAAVWELGNEVNAYLLFHGLKNYISPRRYASDIAELHRIVRKEKAGKVAGPATALWPLVGEFPPFLRPFLKTMNAPLDILTWHYYPQQSSRCPVASRRARPHTLLNPHRLDELGKYARRVSMLAESYVPNAEVWLGETGHAQCGGEPGISDRFVSSLWWLDSLGQLALSGHRQVVRQALVGGDYGLLDQGSFEPRPDYWATLLWNKNMGRDVYQVGGIGTPKVRFYLHGHIELKGAFTLLVLNLDPRRSARVRLPGNLPPVRRELLVTAEDLLSDAPLLNSKSLKLQKDGSLPELGAKPCKAAHEIEMPPGSWGFFILIGTGNSHFRSPGDF